VSIGWIGAQHRLQGEISEVQDGKHGAARTALSGRMD
jgi:hypothetical protein